jgi:hypothetical protein
MDTLRKINYCTNKPSLQTFRSYPFYVPSNLLFSIIRSFDAAQYELLMSLNTNEQTLERIRFGIECYFYTAQMGGIKKCIQNFSRKSG